MNVETRDGIRTFMDCEDREKKYILEPYCQFGTTDGWISSDTSGILDVKVFLHPCSWKLACCQCPRGFAR